MPSAKEGVAAAPVSAASKLDHDAQTEDVRYISHAPASSSSSSPAAAVAAKKTGAHISQQEVPRRVAQQAQAEASQHRELLKDEFQEQQRAQAIKEDRDRAAQELAAERYQGMSRRTDNCL
jgi:hypothetical protein